MSDINIGLTLLGVPIVFNVSSFKFYKVKSPTVANNEWSPNLSDLNLLDYQAWGNVRILLQTATEAETAPEFTDTL